MSPHHNFYIQVERKCKWSNLKLFLPFKSLKIRTIKSLNIFIKFSELLWYKIQNLLFKVLIYITLTGLTVKMYVGIYSQNK